MKVLSFDQFEFEKPDSEEHLEVALSRKSAFPHPDARSFVASVLSVAASEALPLPEPFTERHGYGLVRAYLSRFAGIELPPACSWPTYIFVANDDEFHSVMCGPDLFISYFWSTSA